MKIVLDTDTCIALIKGNPQAIQGLQAFLPSDICVTTISQAELEFGARKSQKMAQNLATLEAFLLPLQMLVFDTAAAKTYGIIRADLERRGLPIGPNDLKIAAIAKSLDLTLVTHNTREFGRVSGLQLLDFLES